MARIRRIKPHVITHCTFCKAAGVRMVIALWCLSHSNSTACAQHKPQLEAEAEAKNKAERYDPADFKEWQRFTDSF